MAKIIKRYALLLVVTGAAGCGASLLELSKHGDVGGVQRAIDGGSNVNARTVQGHSPLTLAAREGHLDVVNALIRAGAELDIRAWTLGARAQVRRNRRDFSRHSRERFVNADSSGPQSRFMAERTRSRSTWVLRDGKTALMLAAQRGHRDIVNALIEAGAKLNATSGGEIVTGPGLSYEDYHVYTADARRRGAAESAPEPEYRPGNDRRPDDPGRSYSTVDYAYPKRPYWSPGGKTALDFAYENGHTDVVDLLLEAGALTRYAPEK
ncbi:MAG: hypothetical protein OXH06_09605 [Gemmatimonadetes bacterium]|nr:hypothetical protein [Gemmatimonadota bacterium]MDE3256472.1 hypothetical protein [Gemmatimonadota bacterium]